MVLKKVYLNIFFIFNAILSSALYINDTHCMEVKEEEFKSECSICKDELIESDKCQYFNCQHSNYHEKCIKEWFIANPVIIERCFLCNAFKRIDNKSMESLIVKAQKIGAILDDSQLKIFGRNFRKVCITLTVFFLSGIIFKHLTTISSLDCISLECGQKGHIMEIFCNYLIAWIINQIVLDNMARQG